MKYSVCYTITDKCNYDCSYCYRNDYKDELFTVSNEHVDNLYDNLDIDEILYFQIIGGEPTVVPNTLLYVLSKFHTKVSLFKINSNGTNYKIFKEIKNKNRYNIFPYLTVHPVECTDKNLSSITKIIDLYPNTRISIMLDCRDVDKLSYVIKYFENTPHINFNRIFLNDNYLTNMSSLLLQTEYLPFKNFASIVKSFPQYKTEFLKNPVNNHYKQVCYNNKIIVDKTGEAKYDSCHNLKYIGNLYETKFVEDKSSVICTKNMFNCISQCKMNFNDELC